MKYNVENKEEKTKGSYFIREEGKKIAEMTYSIAGEDKIIIDHTEVSEFLRRNGIGEMLVRRAVEDARSKGIKIIPLCSFAKSVFDKNEELRDVL